MNTPTADRADRFVRALAVSPEVARLTRELQDADDYTDDPEAEIRALDARLAAVTAERDRLACWRDWVLLYLGADVLVVARLRGR